MPHKKNYHKNINDSDIPNILNLRRQGMFLEDIGKIYGVSPYPISQICRANNVFHKYTPGGAHFWTNDRKEKLAQMWRDGASYDDMQKVFGKSVGAISVIITTMRREGWDVPRRTSHPLYIRKPGVSIISNT